MVCLHFVTIVALFGSLFNASFLYLGIFPRSGRGIKFTDTPKYIRSTYNFSPSFCYYACHHVARMLNRSYSRDTFDLEEINLHNGIEHDASLTRT
jgi:hypothetical protein